MYVHHDCICRDQNVSYLVVFFFQSHGYEMKQFSVVVFLQLNQFCLFILDVILLFLLQNIFIFVWGFPSWRLPFLWQTLLFTERAHPSLDFLALCLHLQGNEATRCERIMQVTSSQSLMRKIISSPSYMESLEGFWKAFASSPDKARSNLNKKPFTLHRISSAWSWKSGIRNQFRWWNF